MDCSPTGIALVFRVAIPPLSVPLPRDVPPALNVTDPVGVPALLLAVAVSVIDEPSVGERLETANTTVDEVLTTTCVTVAVAVV